LAWGLHIDDRRLDPPIASGLDLAERMPMLSEGLVTLLYFSIAPLIAGILSFRRHTVSRMIAVLLIAIPLISGLVHVTRFLFQDDPIQSLWAAIELMAAAIAVAVTTMFWSEEQGQDGVAGINLAEENETLRVEIERRVMNEGYLRRAFEDLEQQVDTTTTALGLAYEKLNANRQRLAFALEGANDGLWDWKLKEEVIYFSARLAEMMHHPSMEMTVSVKKRWALIHRDDRARALKAFHAHIEGKTELYESEHRLRTADGSHL